MGLFNKKAKALSRPITQSFNVMAQVDFLENMEAMSKTIQALVITLQQAQKENKELAEYCLTLEDDMKLRLAHSQ